MGRTKGDSPYEPHDVYPVFALSAILWHHEFNTGDAKSMVTRKEVRAMDGGSGG